MKIRDISHIYEIKCKSKLFYKILSDKLVSKGNMESVYAREFNVGNKPQYGKMRIHKS